MACGLSDVHPPWQLWATDLRDARIDRRWRAGGSRGRGLSGGVLVAGVCLGFGEQRAPGVLVAVGDRGPFLERAAGRRERLGLAGVDELGGPGSGGA